MPLKTLVAFCALAVGTLNLPACGAESGADTRVRKEWRAGETDPFGCPIVDPVVWESIEAHQGFCGDACAPMAGRGISPGDDGQRFFVACVAGDIPSWPGGDLVSAISVCLTSPVNDRDYLFGNPKIAWPLALLCWPPCGSEVLSAPSETHEVPAECFEEPR